MRLNADFAARAIVHAGEMPWVPSPAKGVERRMLFRIGEEKARATSIVRYAPGSRFPRHGHPGGEEFLVLEGVFQDESGDFPAGTYVRNPPGTAHAPASEGGCTILVMLWQFRATDLVPVVRRGTEGLRREARPGVASSLVLFDDPRERVAIEEWEPDAKVEVENPHGLQLLVLDGGFDDERDTLRRWSWLRLPAGETLRARVSGGGARVWMKSAPALHMDVCAFDAAAPR